MIELADETTKTQRTRKARTPKAPAVAKPKPDGTVALLFRTEITPEERTRMRGRLQDIAKELAALRTEAAGLKARSKRKATAEKIRVRLDMAAWKLSNVETGEEIHPQALTEQQWASVIAAAKAAQA